MPKKLPEKVRVVADGINTPEHRYEQGDIVTVDELGKSASWLLEQGIVEAAELTESGRAKPMSAEDKAALESPAEIEDTRVIKSRRGQPPKVEEA